MVKMYRMGYYDHRKYPLGPHIGWTPFFGKQYCNWILPYTFYPEDLRKNVTEPPNVYLPSWWEPIGVLSCESWNK